jgi:hypothetical protein
MTPATPTTKIDSLPSKPNHTVVVQALNAARRQYPGVVGELLCREIEVWQEFGHLLGAHALMRRLFEFLLQEPVIMMMVPPPPRPGTAAAEDVVHVAEIE